MARRVLDVFLSSTAMDLAAHRAAVYERLTRTGLFHCARQEDFGAQDASAIEHCRREVRKADLFAGLIGLRRGWEPDGDNAQRSITEMEHDWAKEGGRRRFLWVAPDDFSVPGNLRESDEQHSRQMRFRGQVMGAGERIVSQKGFGSPELLASEIVEHLLAQVVTGDLIALLRPELARQDAGSAEEQAPAIAAAVERLAEDKEVDLLTLAKDPKGVDVAELEAKLRTRAESHEAAGQRESKTSAEYWRHIGALARLHDTRKALAAYTKAIALDPDDREALYWHGYIQIFAGDLDLAERSLNRLSEASLAAGDDRGLYRAHLRLGEILVARGDLARARQSQDRAHTIAKLNSERLPHDFDWQRDLSVSHIKIGDVLRDQGNLPAALTSYQASHDIFDRLAKADPGNAGWLRDLSVSHDRIGDMLVEQGNLPAALESYQAALAIADRLAKADPGNAGWQRDLSVSHNKIGDVLRDQGNLAQALESYRASLDIFERLAKADPGNAGWQRDLSVSQGKIGDVLRAQGHLPAALELYRASLAIAERLAKADPENADWQRDLSVSHDRIGEALQAQGNLPDALTAYKASLGMAERLAKADPGNAGWQHDVALSLQRVGHMAVEQGQRADAIAAYRRGLEIMQRLARLAPDHAVFKRDLAWFEGEIAALKR